MLEGGGQFIEGGRKVGRGAYRHASLNRVYIGGGSRRAPASPAALLSARISGHLLVAEAPLLGGNTAREKCSIRRAIFRLMRK